MTRAELIKALESLEGPSREMDLECWWWGKAIHSGKPMDPDYKAANLRMNDAPPYTSSIDSALTLVPPEWRVASFYEMNNTPGFDWLAVLIQRNFPGRDGVFGRSKIPAIALTIAALKAQESPQ